MSALNKILVNLAAIGLITLLLSGCVSMGKVELEVLKPPRDKGSVQLNEVKLHNQFLQNNKKSKGEFENLVKYDKYRIDSLVSVELIKSAGEKIRETELISVNVLDTLGTRKVQGTNSFVLKAVDIVSEVETEPIYVNSRGAYYAAVRVPYKVVWAVLLDNQQKDVVFHDTVWAEGYKRDFDNLSELVRFNDVIEYIIQKTGVEFIQKYVPHWRLTRRVYYRSGNNDFQRAAHYMDNEQYDKAAEIWERYAVAGKSNIASNAQLNLAVYHELKGDIDKAIEFAQKAASGKNSLAAKYLEILENRKKEIYQLLEAEQ